VFEPKIFFVSFAKTEVTGSRKLSVGSRDATAHRARVMVDESTVASAADRRTPLSVRCAKRVRERTPAPSGV